MKKTELGEEALQDRDILIAIPSVSLAIGFLYFPRKMAEVTIGLDAVIGITVGFIVISILTWMIVKVAMSFPKTSFMDYASKLVSKPVAILFTWCFVVHGIFLTAFQIRAIAEIAHLHLLQRTPLVISALAFFLVVIYAVSGSRFALFRLNELFFPIVLFIGILVALLSIGIANPERVFPIMQTDVKGHLVAMQRSTLAISGFGVIGYMFFYVSLVKKPEKTAKKAILGVFWTYFLHIILYVACILIFGISVTSNLMFPVIDVARAVEIPGEFFTRFESLFFIIWMMTIFNTCTFSFDVAIKGIESVFKKTNKMIIIFILSPLIFFISGLQKTSPEVGSFGRFVGYFGLIVTVVLTFLLFAIQKIKGVKKSG